MHIFNCSGKISFTALLQDSSLFADALEAGSKVNEPRKRKRASKDGAPEPLVLPVAAPVATPISAPVSAPALGPLAMKTEPVGSPAQISPTALKPTFKVTPMSTSSQNTSIQITVLFIKTIDYHF